MSYSDGGEDFDLLRRFFNKHHLIAETSMTKRAVSNILISGLCNCKSSLIGLRVVVVDVAAAFPA